MDTRCGTFTSAHDLLDLLRARQAEIGLSNESLADICDLAGGVVDKYLGPSRVKFPGLLQVSLMMDALGLSGELFVDPKKVAKVVAAWRRQGQRRTAAIRVENPRVSKAMVRRARPVVLNEMRSAGGKARWAGITVEQRSDAMRSLTVMRWKNKHRRIRAKHV